MTKRFVLTILLAALACLNASSAFAASPPGAVPDDSAPPASRSGANLAPKLGFSVAPLSLTDIRLSPGQTITGTLQVFTYGGGRHFEVSVGEAAQGSDGAYILKRQDPDNDDPHSVANWLTATPGKFESGPGDTEPITWTVQVPDTAEPGDYVGLIYIRRLSEDNESTRLNVEYAVRAEITVLGEVKFNPVIEQINVPSLSNGDHFDANLRLTNRGNVRLDLDNANARLEFLVDGKVRKRYRLEGLVYPDVSRVWKFTWKNPPRFARVQTRVTIDFPEQGDRPATTVKRSAGSWILPYRELFFAIIIIGVLLSWLLKWLRGRRQRRQAQAAALAEAEGLPLVADEPDSADDPETADSEMRVIDAEAVAAAEPVEPDEAEPVAEDLDDDDDDPYENPDPPKKNPFRR
jgi:hypothetical protein